MYRMLPLLLLALLMAAPARADQWDRLREDPAISEGLVSFAIARHIHNRCDSISARRLRAMGFINSLIGQATDLGYTRDEIEDYVFNEAEQDRVRAIADDRLAARGASPSQWEGYCTVGQEEITANSQIGRLLR
mgnify:CR=1 FL=1